MSHDNVLPSVNFPSCLRSFILIKLFCEGCPGEQEHSVNAVLASISLARDRYFLLEANSLARQLLLNLFPALTHVPQGTLKLEGFELDSTINCQKTTPTWITLFS